MVAALALAGVATACGGEPATHHELEVRDLAFQPTELTVAVGDTVSWRNHDIVPHTVSARDGSWDSGSLDRDGRYTWIAATPDTVRYFCRFHPTMVGTVVARR